MPELSEQKDEIQEIHIALGKPYRYVIDGETASSTRMTFTVVDVLSAEVSLMSVLNQAVKSFREFYGLEESELQRAADWFQDKYGS